uniref:Tachylectin 5A-like isoform 2 n=1 Tax=Cupiennius salei TaxID=6928 RepID=A0A4Y5UGI3_CUPSA|nr:tachylectin 5A-like isoform 2 [Cupiennius salei]
MHLLLVLFIVSSAISSEAGESGKCDSEWSQNVTEYSRDSFIVSLLNDAERLLAKAKRHASTGIGRAVATPSCEKPMDCFEIHEKDQGAKSGEYKIWPRSRISNAGIVVYCDMDDDGGSWTVIQRRGDFNSGPDYFYRDWAAYKAGFGDPMKDFWLGNDNIFALTNQRANSVKFILSDWEANTTYAVYDEFWIDDEINKYTLHVKGYRGTAGDSFVGHNGAPFSTKDKDNDRYDKNCAELFKGGWWYTACHASNLNGLYLKGPHKSHADGVEWQLFRGHYYSLKDTVIKIRPRDFKGATQDATPQ